MAELGSRAPVVGIYDGEPDEYLGQVRELVPEDRLRICHDAGGLQALADVEVVLAFKFGGRPFPRESLLGLPGLRWVQLASAGSDHLLPFDATRLTVTSASGIHGATMAEYVIGLLIHQRWNVARLMQQQASRDWARYEVATLQGLTMGIVGAGQVGGALAERARAFGMRTIGVRRSGRPQAGFDETVGPAAMERVLGAADVVVLTLPLTGETRGLIGATELGAFRPGAWLVNVSRGGIVDETALLDALERGHLGGAILDVFEREPLAADSPFWALPNVLVTPHIASEFAGWPSAVARLFCANLRRYVGGEPLVNVVDAERGY